MGPGELLRDPQRRPPALIAIGDSFSIFILYSIYLNLEGMILHQRTTEVKFLQINIIAGAIPFQNKD